MKEKILSGIAIVLIMTGCRTLVKLDYGVRKPRLETDESVRKYLSKKGQDPSKNLGYKDMMSFATAASQDLMAFPEAFFFNQKGELVRYKPEFEKCNAHVADFIGQLKGFDTLPTDPKLSLNQVKAFLEGGERISSENADVTVLITWATYVGKVNKQKAFLWTRLLDDAKTKGVNLQYYLVNCDYRRDWNIPTAWREKLGIKK